jgi:hypothetical protein
MWTMPREPRRPSRSASTAEIGDRRVAADRGERALAAIAEGRWCRFAAEIAGD